MGVLKKLFGGSSAGNHGDRTQTELFDQEWFAALRRFQQVAGIESMRFDLRHPNTNQIMRPHEGLGGTFEDWKKVQSIWNRRRLLFELLLNTMNRSMTGWQIANILVAIRHPDQALALLRQSGQPTTEAKDYAQHCEAYARAFQYLQQPNEALEWARNAQHGTPSKSIQMRFADVLYMTGACDEADQIYTALMRAERLADVSSSSAGIALMFAEIFALETGAVPSPIFAIEIGEKLSDPQQAAEFWQMGEAEFYDSPYFRMHHAYFFVKQNENARSLAKLVALVQEMPWLREATLNLEILFKSLDPSGTKLMPEFQTQIRENIEENHWTTKGMWEIKLNA